MGPVQKNQSTTENIMDAVVFSSYIPSYESIQVGKQYLDVLQRLYSDCDFYIGINPNSRPEWIDILLESGLNITIGHVEPSLVVNSDASSFQTALSLLKYSGKDYDIVWFGHTKGATTDRPLIRRYLINNFFYQRSNITALFKSYPRMGAYGRDVTISSAEGLQWDKPMDMFFDFPYSPISTYYLYTFYCIRGSIVSNFIRNCSDDLFTKNLVEDLKFDRWFFEQNFAKIAERSGYYPFFTEAWQHLAEIPVTPDNLDKLYANWEQTLPENLQSGYRPSWFMSLSPHVSNLYLPPAHGGSQVRSPFKKIASHLLRIATNAFNHIKAFFVSWHFF